MASSGLIDSGDQDPRVEDYLNDRIQSTQDLQNLDDILRALHEQHELQRKQLGEAEGILEQALKASTSHNAKVKEMADAFEEQQHDVEQQLLTVAESHATDEAVVKFQSWMQKIQTFEIAKGYMEILKEVEELRQEALSHLKDTPELAIPPYRRLWEICNGLREAQPAAEGAASHLVDRAEQLRTQLRESLEKNFGDRLRSALTKLKWPGPKLELSDESLDEMEFAFHLLHELQEP
ncbi:hypothetical protein KEM55_007151 [Ascosphaera atra]|nr:hypothetical protein KEM55_007151 [Ascosphaera atra]